MAKNKDKDNDSVRGEGDGGSERGVREVAPVSDLAVIGIITALTFWPVGLAASLVARHEARRNGERGEGLAVVGICLSALSGFFWSLLCLALLIGFLGGNGNFRTGRGVFVNPGTIMRVAPGTGVCTTPLSANAGGSVTCSNGTYVNPGVP